MFLHDWIKRTLLSMVDLHPPLQVMRASRSSSATCSTTSRPCCRATARTSPPPCPWRRRPLPRPAAAVVVMCWPRRPAAAPGSWRATGRWRAPARDWAATPPCRPTSSSTVSPPSPPRPRPSDWPHPTPTQPLPLNKKKTWLTVVTIIMNNNHNNYDVNDDNISNQTLPF